MTEVGCLHIRRCLDHNCARLLTQTAGNVPVHVYAQFGAGYTVKNSNRNELIGLIRGVELNDDLLIVLLADNAHQFADAILLQLRRFALQREDEIIVLGRVENNQLIPTRCYANGGQLQAEKRTVEAIDRL